MDTRDRLSAADIAGRFQLRRSRPNEWRGTCPVCNYEKAFVVSNKGGRPLFWCANGCARDALTAIIFGDDAGSRPRPVPASPSADRRDLVGRLWRQAKPVVTGSLVWAYLESRSLRPPPCDTLRDESRALHTTKSNLAAMRAAVLNGDGELIALHSTFLRADGGGKANIEPQKTTLGQTRGGAVRLFPAGPTLLIAEGIETALSAAELLGVPAWAALNAGNLAGAIMPPREVHNVIIAVDNDEPGRRSAHQAVTRLKALGWNVKVAIPDSAGDDFNDVLMRRRGLA